MGDLVGLNPQTGQELWKAPGGNLLLWRSGGREGEAPAEPSSRARDGSAGASPSRGVVKERVIATSGSKSTDPAKKSAPCLLVRCLEPRTGKALWAVETPLWGAQDVSVLVDGDRLVGFEATKGERAPGAGDGSGEADFARDTQVLCYRLKEDGLEKLWSAAAPYPAVDKIALAIANGHVYVDGSAETFCLKLDTGEKVGTAKAGGARTQLMFAGDGRVFIQPEGRHGRVLHEAPDEEGMTRRQHVTRRPESLVLLPPSPSEGLSPRGQRQGHPPAPP